MPAQRSIRRWPKLRSWLPWFGTLSVAVLGLAVPLSAEDRTRSLAINSLLLAGSVSGLSLAVGAPLAFLLSRTDLPGRKLAGLLLTSLLFVPMYLQAAAWQAGFGLKGWSTLSGVGPLLLDGWPAVILIHTVAAVPWVVLIVALGLWLAEPELEEEALLDGTPGQVFRRVTLRRSAGAIGAAALWVAVTAAGDMTVTNLFQVRTYAEELYTQFQLDDEPDRANWLAAPGVLGTTLLIVGAVLLTRQLTPHHRLPSVRSKRIFRLGPWRWPLAMLTLFVLLAIVGVPLAGLLYKAGLVITRDGSQWLRGWSLWKCASVVASSPRRFAGEFGCSLGVGALAASVAVLAALPLAWSARRGGWRAAPALSMTAVALAIPGPLLGIAIIWLFNRSDAPWLTWLYDRTVAAPCIAQAIKTLPLATIILWHALTTVPNDLLEAAGSEGAGGLARFWRIALPGRWSAVAIAWLVSLAVAMGELGATILVQPAGVDPLSIRIFGLIHSGVEDQVAGICLAEYLMLLAITAAVVRLATSRMLKRER